MILIGNKENIEEIQTRDKILVDFHATWCGPCRMLAPILEQIESKLAFDIMKIDVDEQEEFAKKNGVMVVPTLILFERGKEVGRKSGFLSLEELQEWLEKK